MREIILKIMFQYKWEATIFITIIYLIILLFTTYMVKLSFEFFVSSLIGYCVVISALHNSPLTLFQSISEKSSNGEVLARGYIILLFSIVLIGLMLERALQ